MDYSAPKGASINSGISDEDKKTAFPAIILYVLIAYLGGPQGWMWVCDLEDAYFALTLMKKYWKLLAFEFEKRVIFPKYVPFGIATGCAILQKLLDIVLIALIKMFPEIYGTIKKPFMYHYLDDTAGGHSKKIIAYWQFILYALFIYTIGLRFSKSKFQGPSKLVLLLGFIFDLKQQTLSLNPEKVKTYLKNIIFLINYPNRATEKLLEMIIGKLRHAAKAIQGGNAFVRGLEEQLTIRKKMDTKTHEEFRLSLEAHHDLIYWSQLLKNYNGVPFVFLLRNKNHINITLFTDAAGRKDRGAGAWDTKGNWFQQKWEKTKLKKHPLVSEKFINELEFLTFTVALLKFTDDYKDKVIHIRCDNAAAVGWMIRKAPSFSNKYHKWISYLLRKIMLNCLKNRTYIWIDYINTKINKRADALSRCELAKPLLVKQPLYPQKIKFKARVNVVKLFNDCVKKCFKN